MTEPYAYCPIDRTSGEIRLLILQSNNDEGIIKCDMQTCDSEARPPYTALSYTWGPDTTYNHIEINGLNVSVRENLWDFLHQQQLHSNYGPFWIDALCIQYSDISERNHQAQLMSSIYSKAQTVLIWLGKEGDDSDIAMRLLEVQDTIFWVHSPYTLDEDSKRLIPNTIGRRVRVLSSVEECSIQSLCKRKYWSRMWIIQETMLASYLEIYCGSKSVPLSNLMLALEDIADAVTFYRPESASFREDVVASPAMNLISGIRFIAQRRDENTPRVSVRFPDLLEKYGDHECGDVRDKVYALTGLASYGRNINIDYRKSTKEVLIDLLYHEGNRMKWLIDPRGKRRWKGDELFKFAQLLSRVLDVPLSETEIQFHVSQSESIAMFRDWEEWD